MVLEKGDMWSVFGKTDLWLFTGNSCLNSRGELVMGSGLAAEVKGHWPRLPGVFGDCVRDQRAELEIYGLLHVRSWFPNLPQKHLGVFQVKRHYREKASLMLIGYNCQTLAMMIERKERIIHRPGDIIRYPITRVDMNFPGIGCGMLQRESVLPIISELPDAVHVWEKA